MLYYAAGRGGEVKFIHWGLVDWDEFFNCPQAWWTRLKTVSKQLLMFQCYRNGWLCDFYHSFGCYFVTDGLLRPQTMQGPAKKRVFPSLFTKSNGSVARKITDLIKKHCDDDLKVITSSRSLRNSTHTCPNSNLVTPEDSPPKTIAKSTYVPLPP